MPSDLSKGGLERLAVNSNGLTPSDIKKIIQYVVSTMIKQDQITRIERIKESTLRVMEEGFGCGAGWHEARKED